MSQFYIKYIDGHMYGPYNEIEMRSFKLSKYTLVLKNGTNLWRELSYFNFPPLSEEEKATYEGAKSPYERPFKHKDSLRSKSYKTAITIIVMTVIIVSIVITTIFLLERINDKRNRQQYHNETITLNSQKQMQIIVHERQN